MKLPIEIFPSNEWSDIIFNNKLKHWSLLMDILSHHQEVYNRKCHLETQLFQLQESYRKLQDENKFLTSLLQED